MSNGSDIAEQIAAALGEASAAIGDGPLLVKVVRDGPTSGPAHDPVIGPDILFENINALFEEYSDYERTSSLVESSDIKLAMAAGQGVTPETTDTIRFSGTGGISETDDMYRWLFLPDDVGELGRSHVIKRIEPFKTGGIDLSYTLHLKG